MAKRAKHFYRAFGLTIESEIPIPELNPAHEQDAQVRIRKGSVPLSLPEPKSTGVCFQAAPGEFLMMVEKVARFLVSGGQEIIIDPDHAASAGEINLFLLGSAMGALLHQRGFLPVHGSALELGNKAVIISGVSGAGKSTLAAALCKRGCRLLADDISVVSFGELSVPYIQPGYPQFKLWTDSLRKLGEPDHSYKRVRADIQKYAIPVPENFTPNPVKLVAIYALSIRNTSGFGIHTLKGIEKFNAIKNNTYRFPFLNGMDLQPQHFTLCTSLAERIAVKKLVRSSRGFELDELADGVFEDIESGHTQKHIGTKTSQ